MGDPHLRPAEWDFVAARRRLESKPKSAGDKLTSLEDAAARVADGDRAQLTTPRGTAEVTVVVHDSQRDGHVSLPNGLGVDHTDDGGRTVVAGVAPNELTSAADRDPWVGTPHHKHVRARLEPLDAAGSGEGDGAAA